MSDDKNWDDMMSQWQSCKITQAVNKSTLDDIKDLEVKTRRKARSMKFFMWGDIIGAMVIIAVFVYQLTFNANDLYSIIILGGSLFIIIPMAFLSVWYRKGTWSLTGNDTKAYLTLALNRCISAIKLAKAFAVTAIIAGIFFVSIILWKSSIETQPIDWPWTKYFWGSLFQFTFFTLMYFATKRYEKHRKLELSKLESMFDELDLVSND